MTSDAAYEERGGQGVSWNLPRIVAVEAFRVRYAPPAFHVVDRQYRGVDEGVEITIQTDGPIPERALAPVLYIGDEPLTESEPAGVLRYRFFGLAPDRLREGAPVALGWTMANSPRVESGFRFRIQGEIEKEGSPAAPTGQ